MRMSFSISRRKATSSPSHSEIAMPSAPVRAVEAGALFSVLGFWHGRLLLTRTAKHVWRSLGVAKLARCKGWMVLDCHHTKYKAAKTGAERPKPEPKEWIGSVRHAALSVAR